MSASTYQLLLAARQLAPVQPSFFDFKTANLTATSKLSSFWSTSGRSAGAAPTTAAVPSRTIAGALGQNNASGDLYYAGGRMANSISPTLAGCYFLFDRLAHSGGLSGTVTGSQTTNLPSAALTRYTDGVGVMAFVEIYSQIGTTATTATCSYTDDSNNSGQTSTSFTIGSTGFREAGVLIPVPLSPEDKGVRAVADINLVGTTGTAGNFGITLARLVAIIPFGLNDTSDIDMIVGGARMTEKIQDDACLFFGAIASSNPPGYTSQIDLVDV